MTMKSPKFITAVVLVVLFLILLIQNTQPVSLKIYFWQISMPQIILIAIVLLIGFVAGYVVAVMTGRSLKRKGPHRSL
jgi:putative membrane protein